MPIEIHELVIRTIVEPAAPARTALDARTLEQLKREITADCLERVRDELAARSQR